MNTLIAKNLNILIDFLAKRDLTALSPDELQAKYKINQADLLILFGGSIPEGADVFAKAHQQNIAKNYLLVGGAGHTTEALRQKMQLSLADIDISSKSEAEIFALYLKNKYNITDCLLETKSTNCGNNITNALELLKNLDLKPKSIIFMQDATMQNRMDAGFRKYCPCDTALINYATYKVHFTVQNDKLCLEQNNIWQMWNIDKYIELLMGEIPRLTDNINGYGPQGKDFIAHVDIPQEVHSAYQHLYQHLNIKTRQANSLYATK